MGPDELISSTEFELNELDYFFKRLNINSKE